MKFSSKILLIVLSSLLTVDAIAQAATPRYPTISGRVTSVTGAPVSNLTLTFESFTHIYKQRTDADGNYKILLPKGVFKMSTSDWIGSIPYRRESFFPNDCRSYFRPFTRSQIGLGYGDEIALNLVLIESGCTYWEDAPQRGSFLIADHVVGFYGAEYETIFFGKPDSGIPDLMVEFGRREEKKNSVVYEFPIAQQNDLIWKKPFPGVMLTYDRTTIYANRAAWDRNKKTVSATGNVIVEDGKMQFRSDDVVIHLAYKPTFDFGHKTGITSLQGR